MGKVIGIDLGTSKSCVALTEGRRPKIIENAEGLRSTPSVVAFTPDGERLVGSAAERQAALNPQRTIFAVKRMMARRYDDPVIESYRELLPYRICKAGNAQAWVQVDDKSYPPSQISAFILQKMKATTEAYLGGKVEQAVITVPAYFNMAQRQATKDAGRIAGLEVLRIISEPTAAALAYGLIQQRSGAIAVYDLGAGHFSISILEIGNGVFEVKSTNGDTFLGGEDFDMRMVNYLADDFQKAHGIDLRRDKTSLQRLKAGAEIAKMELSSTLQTEVNLPFIAADARGANTLSTKLTRARLEALVGDLVEKTVAPCRQGLKDAGLSARDINEVLLVGGMTRMPKVQEAVRQLFGRDPHKGIHPGEAVALGAAIQAGVLQGDVKDVLLLDVIPLSLGIETPGGAFTPLIDRNTTMPTKKSQVFSTTEDNQGAMTIRVFQREREIPADKILLGQLDLVGIPPAPRGVPQIEVTFDIDANEIVNVQAKHKGTDHEQQIRIEASGGLSEADIQGMKKDAETHLQEDTKRRAQVEANNQAESLIHSTEKALAEHGAKISEDEQRAIEDAIANLRQALQGDDAGITTAKANALTEALLKLGEAIYRTKPQNAETLTVAVEAEEIAPARPVSPQAQAPAAAAPAAQQKPIGDCKPGELLGGVYPVVRSLGRGSFGEAFLCRHPVWNIDVAVKVPNETTLADPRAVADLEKDVEEWTGLGLHPHIACCYHLHPIRKVPLLIVEYVAGGTLRHRIQSEKAAVHDVRGNLDIAIQLCHALEHAHSRGLVHGDVTPENILLATSGTAKLTDFGITKRRGDMAPEQAVARAPIEARADLFALGACLYELFCFCLPYTTTEGPPQEPLLPSKLRRDGKLPEGLEQLLLRLVAREPDGRPASAQAVRAKLSEIYRAAFGEASRHAELGELQLTASAHNNRGASYHFLGKHADAEAAFKDALSADPLHPEATYNLGLMRWRKAEITDSHLVKQLEEIRSTNDSWRPAYLLSLVHLERRDREAAIKLLEQMRAAGANSATAKEALLQARGMPDADTIRHIRNFNGHAGAVTSVAFSPDGGQMISGSSDRTVRLWDAASGRCIRALEGHSDGVNTAAFLPNGTQMLSGSDDNSLRLWDAATGKSLRRFDGHTGAVRSVALSPDGRQAVSASWDATLQLWELATGRSLRCFEGHWRSANSVRFSPDNRQILSGSADGTLRLWEVVSGQCCRTFSVGSPVESVAFSPDGRHLLSGSDDKSVRLWDAATGACLRSFDGHASLVTAVGFLQDGSRILSGSWDTILRLWDVASGRCIRTLEGHTSDVTSAAFFPAGGQILSGSRDQTMRLWEVGQTSLDAVNRVNLQLVRQE